MTEALKKKWKDKLIKHFDKEYYAEPWTFRGSEFFRVTNGRVGDLWTVIHFHCGFMWVKAKLFTGDYGIPDMVRMFTGVHAAEECIEWTAERLIELYETVSERTAPYKAGYENYQRALKGEVR